MRLHRLLVWQLLLLLLPLLVLLVGKDVAAMLIHLDALRDRCLFLLQISVLAQRSRAMQLARFVDESGSRVKVCVNCGCVGVDRSFCNKKSSNNAFIRSSAEAAAVKE